MVIEDIRGEDDDEDDYSDSDYWTYDLMIFIDETTLRVIESPTFE